jgi:hypothetical protein
MGDQEGREYRLFPCMGWCGLLIDPELCLFSVPVLGTECFPCLLFSGPRGRCFALLLFEALLFGSRNVRVGLRLWSCGVPTGDTRLLRKAIRIHHREDRPSNLLQELSHVHLHLKPQHVQA